MSWTISAWASGKHPTTGAEQAVRIQIKREERDINEEYGLRSNASGLYRTTYGDWAPTIGSSSVSDDGEPTEPVIPPSALIPDGAESSYTVPDEAVAHLPQGDD